MRGLKKYWDGLSQHERWVILKQNRFWGDLIYFDYERLPEDLKPILRRELDRKRP